MINVSTVGRTFRLRFPYRPDIIERVKAIPGRTWDKPAKQWAFPATSTVAYNIKTYLDKYGLEHDAPFERLLWRYGAGLQVLRSGRVDQYESVTTPFAHQRLGTCLIAARDGTFLMWDMGTGKTKATIDAIINLPAAEKILIVCPLSVIPVWEKQFSIHAKGVMGLQVLPLNGSVANKRRNAELAASARLKTVYLINYESVWREPFAEWVLSQRWDMAVLDESHRAKAHDGKAGRFMGRLANVSIKRVALTGTPMPHDPMDLYAQLRFVDAGVFGTSFGQFKARYTVKGGFMAKEVIGFRNQEEMNKLLYTVGHRVTKDEVLDLPPFTHSLIPVALSENATKVYKKLDEDFVAGVGNGTITVANALVELLRLQQITGGHVTLDEERDETGQVTREKRVERIDTGKEDALVELLEDLPAGERVVVCAKFIPDLDAIASAAKRTGREYRELSGRCHALAEWQDQRNADGTPNKATILGVQIRTGGLGVDMCMAQYAVLYSVGFSLGDYEQFLARVHRQGQTRNVTYYHLVARGTVDDKVYEALQERAEVVASVLESTGARARESDSALVLGLRK